MHHQVLSLKIILALASLALSAPLEDSVSVTQNSLGSYKVLVHTAGLSKSEERFLDGSVIGEYSYPDANGIPQTYKYTAGKDGFQIISGPLPVAPVDTNVAIAETPEVLAARQEHLSILKAAGIEDLRVGKSLEVPVESIASVPSVDIPSQGEPVVSALKEAQSLEVPVESIASVDIPSQGEPVVPALKEAQVLAAPSHELVLPFPVVSPLLHTLPESVPVVPLEHSVGDLVPVPVVDDPEVQAAKEAHFEAHREARARLGLL